MVTYLSTVVQAESLTKFYGDKPALINASFDVRRGEVFSFLGPNGAGKTTTIRLMLGFIKPTRGKVFVYGVQPFDDGKFSRVKEIIGFVPEEFSFPRGLKGRDIVNYMARIRGGSPRLDELLEIFPIDLDKKVETYSRGMKQILAIILAFMSDPELIILDEPTTGLDPLLRERFLSMVREEARKGKTVFLSSHVLSEVQKVADRVCLIRDGRIIALEELRTLLGKAGKIIKAKLSKPATRNELLEVEGVIKVEISNNEVIVIASRGYGEILSLLSSHGILDIEVRGMTLEELFMHFYER